MGNLILLKLLRTDANIENLQISLSEFDIIIQNMISSAGDILEKESQTLQLINRFNILSQERMEFQDIITEKLWEKTISLAKLVTEKGFIKNTKHKRRNRA